MHHHCLLVGYGADAINPYLAFEALWQSRDDGLLPTSTATTTSSRDYRKAVAKGMLKVMAKMGISTLQSYKGAQIFEAVGLADEVIERCFARHREPHQGVSFDVLGEGGAAPARARLSAAIRGQRCRRCRTPASSTGAADGERHMWDPQAIFALQVAARRGNSRRLQAVREARERGGDAKLRAARPARVQAGRRGQAAPARRGRARERDREALLHRRDELRLASRPRRTRRWRSR